MECERRTKNDEYVRITSIVLVGCSCGRYASLRFRHESCGDFGDNRW